MEKMVVISLKIRELNEIMNLIDDLIENYDEKVNSTLINIKIKLITALCNQINNLSYLQKYPRLQIYYNQFKNKRFKLVKKDLIEIDKPLIEELNELMLKFEKEAHKLSSLLKS